MIPELGYYALFLALSLALVQVINMNHLLIARCTAWGQFLLVSFSFGVLAYAFLSKDFSVAYVAQNSNSHLPAIYRFCAVWGAHEGSMLLWVSILTAWMVVITLFNKNLPQDVLARVLGILALIAIGFYLFLITTSNPFLRLFTNTPADGVDLNPILQDPGLAVHPPLLYMGYVGFAVPFAFAIAALLGGRLDPQWVRWSRPWALVAWSFLTLGIVLGSAWAYRELGWGGWWFWDPVENASFLPWLAGTALLHSLIVTEKRQIFKAWTILLAICAFSLSLLGTFLVRSGVLVSVHSFAADPQRGLYMLGFLLIVVGGSLVIYAWRGRLLAMSGEFELRSRETFLLANNILLFVAMLTILLGTIYPLIIDVLHRDKLSVGAPYFNWVFTPLVIPLLILMAIAPLFHWRNTPVDKLGQKILIYLVMVVLLGVLLPWLVGVKLSLWIFVGMTLGFWVIIWTLQHGFRWQGKRAMSLAHLGVGVTVIGIICSTGYTEQRDVSMQPQDFVKVGPYQFQFHGVKDIEGPNYQGLRATVFVYKNEQLIKILYPEQRYFPATGSAVTKAAIDAGIYRDLYVALGGSLANGAWSLRIYYKPFIRWIWAGGILMAIGGILAASNARRRS